MFLDMSSLPPTSAPQPLVRLTLDSDCFGLRICPTCRKVKSLEDFTRNRRRKNGRDTYCKECAKKRINAYRKSHPEVYAETKRRSYEKNKATLNERNRRWHQKNRGYGMIKGAKSRAKQGGMAFDLDPYRDQIQQRVDAGFCELTGIPFNLEGKRTWDTPSLDRIVPEKGYVYGNVRVVCRAMNCMLGNWGPKIMERVFLAWKEQN